MGEFELIAAIRRTCDRLPSNGFEGIGDDCAVLPLPGGEALVFTSDALCEGVHFLRETTSPEELGAKTLAVNLSDVAAMGVRPVATLLSLSLPADLAEGWAARFIDGYARLAERWGVALVGGDTTASRHGVALSVTAIGRGPAASLKRRRDARIGDTIFVSDRLGASAAGLRDLVGGRPDTPAAAIHRVPEPEIEAGCWLGGRREVHAMMDLSDGLASDLRHILEESRAGAAIDLGAMPVAAGATLDDALGGGEDYKLLLTADAAEADRLAADFAARFGRPLYAVGRIVAAAELAARHNAVADAAAAHRAVDPAAPLLWLRDGCPVEGDWQGFRHF